MNHSPILPGILAKLTITVSLIAMTGCSEYTARRDAIAPSFGNALASNTALQTIDPWPRYVERTHIHTDGARASNAIDAYRAPPEEGNAQSGVLTVVAPTTQPGATP